MDPVFIHRSRDVLARTARGQAATQLLTQSDNLEVSRHDLPPSTPLKVFPPEKSNDSEIFYVLSGQLKYRDGDQEIVIEPGDCIVTQEVDESAYFEAATEVALLQITSLPAFADMKAVNRQFFELAEQVEADEHMEGHSKRLEHMANRLGHRLGLPAQRLYHIRYAAYFHDIGKTKVPDHIIQKPGSPTDDEWEILKRHSEWGRELLEEQPGFEDVGRIVEQIHERVDGDGYPHGLVGDEIRLEAKVIAVVDAYDAMTTDRPYQTGMPHEDALAELRANSGTQFDPDVVDAFVAEFGDTSPDDDQPSTSQHEFARWSQTERFLELGERILAGQDLQAILEDIVTAITDHTPFQRAALALYDRPIAPDSIEQVRIVRSAQAGLTPEEEAQLRSNPLPPAERKRIFHEDFKLSRSYYIPTDRNPWGERPGFVTGRMEPTDGNWDPEDMLFIPLWLPDHQLLGLISVDDPIDGEAPTAKAIEPVELFANVAGLAIQQTKNIHSLQDRQRRLQSIYQLSESLGSVVNID
ncbi:MAG: HD domain-containing phosphohydrolase, partial [Candidatus Bipolaricaulia bacterium]